MDVSNSRRQLDPLLRSIVDLEYTASESKTVFPESTIPSVREQVANFLEAKGPEPL